MTESKIQLVMVTGMSGAGKTVAIQSFEDLGYFTIDNMPPALLLKFIELMRHSPDNNKLAVVVDMRSRSFFNEIRLLVSEILLRNMKYAMRMKYLLRKGSSSYCKLTKIFLL